MHQHVYKSVSDGTASPTIYESDWLMPVLFLGRRTVFMLKASQALRDGKFAAYHSAGTRLKLQGTALSRTGPLVQC